MMIKRVVLYFLSLGLVAFSQPAWLKVLCPFTAAFGYALVFGALRGSERRFLLGSAWFFLVQCLQLSWMVSFTYQGAAILFVYLLLSLYLGIQFGLLCFFVKEKMSLYASLSLACLWTLLEWSRLYFFSGFPFNPVGLTLSLPYTRQLASFVGIYGLSFWVVLTNCLAYRFFFMKTGWKTWIVTALVPYMFAFSSLPPSLPIRAYLVQTNLLPDEKDPLYGREEHFISPLKQWEKIFTYLDAKKRGKLDLIVFPESALPCGAFQCVYSYNAVQKIWDKFFPLSLPPLIEPYAEEGFVSNAYLSFALANYFQCPIIIGLDDSPYNAAFCFYPEGRYARYEKQILLPVAEYFPFSWCAHIAERYNICAAFSPGKEVKVFPGAFPLSVSICYEEIFAPLIRQGKEKGARLLVNVTNDNWYPKTLLPRQHLEHARLRCVENGLPLLRACNNGITGALDAKGRDVAFLKENTPGALYVELPSSTYPTFYSRFGDKPLLFFSSLLVTPFLALNLLTRIRFRKKR